MKSLLYTYKHHHLRGFTIVELLIVIVVIAILAAVSVSAYTGMQGRARDSQREQDMKSIVKALEMYKTQTGGYPPANAVGANNTISSWEVSSKSPAQFLRILKDQKVISSSVPVDPVNTEDNMEYKYYRYSADTNGCLKSRGDYYVLIAKRSDSGAKLPSSPGFECASRIWSNEGDWVYGAFTNG